MREGVSVVVQVEAVKKPLDEVPERYVDIGFGPCALSVGPAYLALVEGHVVPFAVADALGAKDLGTHKVDLK